MTRRTDKRSYAPQIDPAAIPPKITKDLVLRDVFDEATGKQILGRAAKIPKKDANKYISDGHIHHRAQRYMEKRLLKDLWQAWRTASVSVLEEHRLSAVAEIQQQEAA